MSQTFSHTSLEAIKRTNDLRLWFVDHDVKLARVTPSTEPLVFDGLTVNHLASLGALDRTEFYSLMGSSLYVDLDAKDQKPRQPEYLLTKVMDLAGDDALFPWLDDPEATLPSVATVYATEGWSDHMEGIRCLLTDPVRFIETGSNRDQRRHRALNLPAEYVSLVGRTRVGHLTGTPRPDNSHDLTLWILANWRTLSADEAGALLSSLSAHLRLFITRQDQDTVNFLVSAFNAHQRALQS